MARVVACSQCGAPHRLVDDQNRFQCDWCRVTSTVERDLAAREVVVALEVDPAEARRAVESELRSRGVARARVRVLRTRWIGLWHAVSEAGEEFLGPADPDADVLDRALPLPALPLVERSSVESPLRDFDARPGIPAQQAIEAALSGFDEERAVVESLRLIWMPVADVEVRAAGRRVEGRVVGGTDRVVLASLPDAARGARPRPELLQAYALFAVTAVILGRSLDEPVVRALVEGLWLLLGCMAWQRWHRPGNAR